MIKPCAACKIPFTIAEEDLAFYDKVSPVFNGKKYVIPPPTLCPDCRLQRRTAHRNEQYMYQTKSAFSQKPLIALYDPKTPQGEKYKIISHEEWWSEAWDPLESGRDYDFQKPFFEQFYAMEQTIPRVNLVQVGNENCEFTTGTGYCKNCYLINCSENTEDSCYGKLIQSSRDIMDSDYVYNSELCYECFAIKNCYNCTYVFNSQNSRDCWFSDNLSSCSNCFFCTNLVSKEYYFMNNPCTKEEYEQKIQAWLGSRENIEKSLKILDEMSKKRIHKYVKSVSCENSTGDLLVNCKNCHECFDVVESQDCKYLTVGVQAKDVMDSCNMYIKPELCYETLGTITVYNVLFSIYVFNSQNVMYSQFCFDSQNLFGCAGLRKKQYCIFNKQYTKEEYEQLVPKIIEHMKSTGQWGEFFPAAMSPFGYNESVAQEYTPLTKEEALKKGFHWRDGDKREFKPQTYQIPHTMATVTGSVTKEILACSDCAKNFKIIPQELKRLQTLNLPLPLRCPDCRHTQRMRLKNPCKLYARQCAKCQAPIQTTYAPTRPETVCCEVCYWKDIY